MVDQDRTEDALCFSQHVLQRFLDVLLGVDKVTTPTVELCQTSWKSSSATATLNLPRSRSFRLRRIWRLSLRERASAMCSSSVSKPTGMAKAGSVEAAAEYGR